MSDERSEKSAREKPGLVDAFVIAGFVAIFVGMWMITPAFALIVMGLVLVAVGYLGS